MARVLVTGFEPFGRWSVNSSWQAVRALGAARPDLVTMCLPVDHAAAADAVRNLIGRYRPETILLTGLAPGAGFRVETFARPGPLAPWARDVRAGRWPAVKTQKALEVRGLPARISTDAGRYVCDTTFWAALGTTVPKVGFLHVPPPAPQWSPSRLARALAAALSAAEGCVAQR